MTDWDGILFVRHPRGAVFNYNCETAINKIDGLATISRLNFKPELDKLLTRLKKVQKRGKLVT